jgi:hypothetical protein
MSFIEVRIQIIGNPQPKSVVHLCLTDSLTEIRKQLEKNNIINDALSFSIKLIQSDEFAEIAVENEKEFLLNRVLDEGYNTLYIIKNSNKLRLEKWIES